ncbi:sialate O-acetylesterase [Reichenbachiella sp. MALMAid0571]|uniref:sialate O-acetylesterase n=1 Tax=Reichenbachiella sp. MALMAid0571 TaxID=3143939 RepID=UPI0032DF840C
MKNKIKIFVLSLIMLANGSLVAQFPYTDHVKVLVDDFSNTFESKILQYSGNVISSGSINDYVLTSNYGIAQTTEDRFGNPNRAFSFESTTPRLAFYDNSGTSFNVGFFGSGAQGTQLDQFTISCWVYIDVNDTERRYIFSGSGGSNLASKLGFGLSTDNKQLFLINYVNNSGTGDDNNVWGKGNKIGVNLKDNASIGKSYEARFYGPALFSAGTGWYHIILVQAEYYTKVFVGTPPDPDNPGNGKIGYMGTSFAGSMIIRGRQDITPFTHWFLGKPAASSANHVSLPSDQTEFKPVRRISDFMVYDYDMTDLEAEMLYSCQVKNPTLNCLNTGGNLSVEPIEQTFAIIGDYGCDGGQQLAENDGVYINNPVQYVAGMIQGWQPEYIISLGDDDYRSKANYGCSQSIQDNVGKYFGEQASATNSSWKDYVTPNKFYPTLGNNDIKCIDDSRTCSSIWTDYFPDPTGNNWEHLYYKFSKGNIDFFVINTTPLITGDSFSDWPPEYYMDIDGGQYYYKSIEEQTSLQLKWLRTALQESKATFKVLYTHVPPRGSRIAGDTETMNAFHEALQRWPFDIWGVDVVISGDVHWYERSEYKGVTYVTCATGGYPGLNLESDIDPEQAIPGSTLITRKFGALKVQSSSDMLKFEYYTINDGETVLEEPTLSDEFFIYRPAATKEETYLSKSIDLDIYLMIGNDNLSGLADFNTDEQGGTIDKAYILNDIDEFERVVVGEDGGLSRYSSIANEGLSLKGPAYSFLKQYVPNSDKPVGLIVNAKPGGTISDWTSASQGSYYDMTLERVTNVLSNYPNSNLRGIIWVGDATDNMDVDDHSNYETNMNSILSNVTGDSPMGNGIPVYIVNPPARSGMELSNQGMLAGIVSANQELTEVYGEVCMVSSSGLGTSSGMYDEGEALDEIGLRLTERILNQKTRFAIVGDYGWNLPPDDASSDYQTPEEQVADMISGSDPGFVLTLGDDSYLDDMLNGFDCVGCPTYSALSSADALEHTINKIVGNFYGEYIYGSSEDNGSTYEFNRFFPILGNHDYHDRSNYNNVPTSETNGVEAWMNYFPTEQYNDISGGRYYDFVRGDIHFFALNSNIASLITLEVEESGKSVITSYADDLATISGNLEPSYSYDSDQFNWLDSSLKNSTAKYKVVYMHNPPYASVPKLAGALDQLPFRFFENLTVKPSIVLAGDYHIYERLIDDSGLTYVVNGVGGHPLLKIPTMQDQLSPNSVLLNKHYEWGAMIAEEQEDHLLFKMMNTNGVVRDEFKLYPDGSVVSKPITHDPLAPMDVFLVVGGDNLSGLANFSSEEQSESISGIHILNGQGVFETIITDVGTTEGLNKYSNLNQPGDVTRLGPAYYFAKELASLDGCFDKPVGLIVNAGPGSTISDWTSTATGSNYGKTLSRYNQADGNYDISVKGIIWVGQVEDNTNGTNSAQYRIDMETLISNFHADLGNDIPVYLVAPPANAEDDINVQYDLKGIISANETLGTGAYVQAISSGGIEVSGGDYATRTSLQKIGERMARATCPVTAWIDEIDFDRNITFNTDLSGYDLTLLPSLPVGSYDYSSELSYELDEGLEYSGNNIVSPDQLTVDASHIFSMTAVITNNGVEYKREVEVSIGTLQMVASKLKGYLAIKEKPTSNSEYKLIIEKEDQSGLSINVSLYNGFQSNNNDLLSATSEGWKSSKLSTDYDYTFLFEYVVLENPLSDQSYTWIRQESSNLTSSDRRRLAADALGIEDVSFDTFTPSTATFGHYDVMFTYTDSGIVPSDLTWSYNGQTVTYDNANKTIGPLDIEANTSTTITLEAEGTVSGATQTISVDFDISGLPSDQDIADKIFADLTISSQDYTYDHQGQCRYGVSYYLSSSGSYAMPAQFEAECQNCSDNFEEEQSIVANGLMGNMTGLENGIKYSYSWSIKFTMGGNTYSKFKAADVFRATPAAKKFSAQVSENSVVLSWQHPDIDDLTGYTLSYNGNVINLGADVNSYTVNGVAMNGDQITFSLKTLGINNYAGCLATTSATLLSTSDDLVVNSISNPSVVEGNTAAFTVTFDNALNSQSTIAASLSDGTATGGVDYVKGLENATFGNNVSYSNSTLVVPAGVLSFEVLVSTIDDNYENNDVSGGDRIFYLKVGSSTEIATIQDNDGTKSVSSVTCEPSATEGKYQLFDVSFDKKSKNSKKYQVSLAGTGIDTDLNNATFNNNVKYSNVTHYLDVPGSVTQFTLSALTVNDDYVNQTPLTYSLTVDGTNCQGSITDDELAGVESVDQASVNEGGNLEFKVTLKAKSNVSRNFSIQLSDNTAFGGTDYDNNLSNINFTEGVSVASDNSSIDVPDNVKTFNIIVPTYDRIDIQGQRKLTLHVGGQIGNGLINDYSHLSVLSVSSDNCYERNGCTLTFGVKLHQVVNEEHDVDVSIQNSGNANAISTYSLNLATATISDECTFYNDGSDGTNGTITIPTGVSSFNISFDIADDDDWSKDKHTFTLKVGTQIGTGTIYDDESECYNSDINGKGFDDLFDSPTDEITYNHSSHGHVVREFSRVKDSGYKDCFQNMKFEITTIDSDHSDIIDYLHAHYAGDDDELKVVINKPLSHLQPGSSVSYKIQASWIDEYLRINTVSSDTQTLNLGVSPITGIEINHREVNQNKGYTVRLTPKDKDHNCNADDCYTYEISGASDYFYIDKNHLTLKEEYWESPFNPFDQEGSSSYTIKVKATKIYGDDITQERHFTIVNQGAYFAFLDDFLIGLNATLIMGISHWVLNKVVRFRPSIPRLTFRRAAVTGSANVDPNSPEVVNPEEKNGLLEMVSLDDQLESYAGNEEQTPPPSTEEKSVLKEVEESVEESVEELESSVFSSDAKVLSEIVFEDLETLEKMIDKIALYQHLDATGAKAGILPNDYDASDLGDYINGMTNKKVNVIDSEIFIDETVSKLTDDEKNLLRQLVKLKDEINKKQQNNMEWEFENNEGMWTIDQNKVYAVCRPLNL